MNRFLGGASVRRLAVGAVLGLSALAAAPSAQAGGYYWHGGGGYWHGGGGYWHGGGGYWHGGWGCCWGGTSVSLAFGFPGYYPYYAAPYPYYPAYPAYSYAPPYSSGPGYGYSAPPPSQSLPPPQQSWYYCDNPRGYYPYVQNCSNGWRQVSATPPGLNSASSQ